MKLDKIYKYLGIDPDVKGCTCRDEEGVCQAKWEYGGQHCFPHEYETCKQAVTWTDYPEIEEIPDSYVFNIMDIISIEGRLEYQFFGDFEEPYTFTFGSPGIRTYGKNRTIAILRLVEKMLDMDKFNAKQKNDLFYVLSYISIYQEE